MNEEQEVGCIQLLADKTMTRMLLKSVEVYLEKWPGGDPNEQAYLMELKKLLQAAALELQFHS